LAAPNYRQQKQRREAAQKKKKDEKDLRKAARKGALEPAEGTPGTGLPPT
jgi:hypothetical protein